MYMFFTLAKDSLLQIYIYTTDMCCGRGCHDRPPGNHTVGVGMPGAQGRGVPSGIFLAQGSLPGLPGPASDPCLHGHFPVHGRWP